MTKRNNPLNPVMIRALAGLTAVLLLAGCADFQNNPKRSVGTLLGGGVGTLLGSQLGSGGGQLAAVAIGTLGGAFLGSELGRSLDRADRLHMQQSSQRALEHNRSGLASTWRNPDTGHSGIVTPTRTYRDTAGRPCRDFQQTVAIDGRTDLAHGTACRQPDGTVR